LNISIQNELIPLRPGEMLRHAREGKGLTLESVAKAIKVKPEVLDSIELGETGHIPTVYLKGHIRSYARYLDIELSSIERHMPHAKGAEPSVQTIFKEGPPKKQGDRWLKATSYVLASVVVSALVWQITNQAVHFSQGDPILRSADNEASNAQTSLSNEQSSKGDKPTNTHLRASIASGNLNSGNLKTENTSPGRPAVAENAWAAITKSDALASERQELSAGIINFEITTSADSWVEIVDGNGQSIEMDLLRAGNRRTYSGAAPVHMLLGRASSVEVFQNGDRINLAPHTRGNVARLTLKGAEPLIESESSPP